jgi:predicted nicotinamide N-methyase
MPFSDSFLRTYETDTSDLSIRGRSFSFFVPKNIDRFVHAEDVFSDFPLWSKIWEASIVLADHLAGIPVDQDKHFLEIGGGMGIVSIVASCFGHRVTMTEYNEDALNFARANSERNPAPSPSLLEIEHLDWFSPSLQGTFDYIVGSEVIYKEEDFQPILNLFQSYLKKGGQIMLAEGARKTSIEFFKRVGNAYEIKAQKKILRSSKEEIMVILCTMKPRT